VRAGVLACEAARVAPVAPVSAHVVVPLDAPAAGEASVFLVYRHLELAEAAGAVPGRQLAGPARAVALSALAFVPDVPLHAAVGAVAGWQREKQRVDASEAEGRVVHAGLAVRTALVALVVEGRYEVSVSAEIAGSIQA